MLTDRDKLLTLIWLLSWGVLSSAWCVTAGHELGPTFDEPFYLQAGLQNWRDWNHRELLCQGTMPLGTEVQTLLLRLADVLGTTDPAADLLAWLPTARLGTLVFWWLLLWASNRLATIYGGSWAGRLAVALVACEPLLLGHASLATTDLPFTACLLTMIAVFRARREESSWSRRLVLPAVCVMLAFLAKASAVMFVPVCLSLVEFERLWSAGWRPGRTMDSWRPALASLGDLTLIGLMGVVLLFIVCPRAWRGLSFQIHHHAAHQGQTYLFGELRPDGFWYYFAAALAIKLGLPILLLLAGTLMLRPRGWLNGPLSAAAGLLILTPSIRLQIGVRYVLPIAVLAIVGGSAVLARWRSEQPPGWRRVLTSVIAAVLVLWSLASAVHVWPHGICYTNELFGGTSNGQFALTDSNYDWGQGLPELTRWQAQHADTPVYLSYFGTDPNAKRLPFRPVSFNPTDDSAPLAQYCHGGYYAISTSFVYGSYFDTPFARHLRTLKPCDRTTTYLIFDFTHGPRADHPSSR